MNSNENPVVLADFSEQDEIDRRMLAWANTFPDSPVGFIKSLVELTAPSMALQVIQGANIVRQYITGGYEGEYQFAVTYRIKSGNSEPKRMDALEILNRFGSWACTQKPDIGDGLQVIKIAPSTRAFMLAPYEDGDEDYQILMKMTYERIQI